MNAEELVKGIRSTIINDNLEIYRDLYESTQVENATDEYWNEALKFYSKLSPDDRDMLFRIMRQVSVDTVSNFFAILDGVSHFDGQDDDLFLAPESELENRLNGGLQDIFLEIEEG